MRAPSTKKLVEAFRDLNDFHAKLIRKFAKAADDPEALEDLVEKVPGTAAYVRQLHSSPYTSQMWRNTVALHAIDKLVEGHGVESLGERYDYVNMGDNYATTLIYDSDQDRLFLGTWEDVTEKPGFEWEREENPARRWALAKGDRLVSSHATKAAAEKAMRKAGGEGMRIVDVGPSGTHEVIHVQGRGAIRLKRANNPGTTSADLAGKLKF